MKIICIGRNYVEHIRELDRGHKSDDKTGDLGDGDDKTDLPAEPIFFLKPDTALLRNNDPFYVPSFSRELHYETELVVRIDRVGRSIEERFARRCYSQVGLGIDFTARDLQAEAIRRGLPWEISKGFDRSAALSARFLLLEDLGDIQNLQFEMRLNGELRQSGDTSQMIFSVDRIISYVSRFMTLRTGDLLYTGTPVGVGPVRPGDRLTASLMGHTLLDFDIK
ncbi:MAG: fumarylacetoacetate hydrolase family protein [Rikenellaceae bacterium]|jgi:2-keto-4-pentenoate hydratase/2-oxohepta-3-ene-1,7-dioic acid hydratase in catechol pathway|nr:fumarylacetoacetate hydrolase family protein [Rikenellaceae bacterium]